MVQFSDLTFKAAVANHSEAMESRDHFKKGTSSKYNWKHFFCGGALLWAVVTMASGQDYFNDNDFTVIKRNNDVFVFEYNGTKQNVTIPTKMRDMNVIFIGAHAFRNKNLTSVTIPNSVTSIRANAFSSNNLTSVTIPNSVTTIWTTAFLQNPIICITIGANVQFHQYTDSNGITHDVVFDNGFDKFYIAHGRIAGTYMYSNGHWNVAEQ